MVFHITLLSLSGMSGDSQKILFSYQKKNIFSNFILWGERFAQDLGITEISKLKKRLKYNFSTVQIKYYLRFSMLLFR